MNQSEWVPDMEGSGCCICHSEFSLTLRRHHCRKCGALVCASCSDHFVTLGGCLSSDSSASPKSAVRICDTCELHLSTGTGEELAVSEQISESLKVALREKAAEIEKFNSFLLHVLDDGETGRMDALRSEIESLCSELKTESEQYSRVKMDSADLEKDIRTVAQRCLKAEQQAREALPLAREIEEYSRHIGLQAKLADQFSERISRLHSQRLVSATRRINSPPAEIMSPRYQITEVGGSESFCQVLKSLLYFP